MHRLQGRLLSGFKSWLSCLLAGGDLSVQHLSFVICKMGWQCVPHSMVKRLIQRALGTLPGMQ